MFGRTIYIPSGLLIGDAALTNDAGGLINLFNYPTNNDESTRSR
jgi:hypothetical protein